MIDKESFLWAYLQPELKQLITDGFTLVDVVKSEGLQSKMEDFSFLVFPFSKAYEGFLKKLFLDIGMIHYDDYYGDEIRIGRLLNPQFKHESKSIFTKLCNHSVKAKEVSMKLWETWKNGRNLVFHYFPHNYKRLSYDAAVVEIGQILGAMELAVKACDLK